MRFFFLISLLVLISLGCENGTENNNLVDSDLTFDEDVFSDEDIVVRSFNMGFTTWIYEATWEAREDTYNFLAENGDIYSEHIDNKIPWNAWINGTELPAEFTDDIDYRVAHKIKGNQFLLSVGLLNTARAELSSDYDGSVPEYSSMNDEKIENAYFKHLSYLISRFDPDYLVAVIEANQLKINSPDKWDGYKALMKNIRTRIKAAYPDLKIAESVTLHDWCGSSDDESEELADYVNSNNDFIAVSYYPFIKNFHSKEEFQSCFDFLNSKAEKPIAFAETSHLAEDLVIENLNVNISGNPEEQKLYLKVLLDNAARENYEFVIWWTHRDYDALWETFPDDVKDTGKIWRDTGLLDENGNKRVSYDLWKGVFSE